MKKKNSFYPRLIAVIIVGIMAMLILFVMTSKEKDYDEADKSWEPHNINMSVNDEGKLQITYEGPANAYIMVSEDEEVRLSDEGWIKMKDKKAVFDIKDHVEYYYMKYSNKIYDLGSNEDICKIDLKISDDEEVIYLALGEEYDLEVIYDVIGYTHEEVKWQSSNKDVVTVEEGHLTTKGYGEASITAYLLNKSAIRKVVVSDLIVKAPEKFDEDKEDLPCGLYSKEENDTLDAILEERIARAGYMTRAGAVEAARFLTLNFPYKIKYFYEWGRQGLDKIDGEGRYYLKGLYLDESRFERLMGSNTGPQTWGCQLYAQSVKLDMANGLDCSGFVTWALYNAGFDCGDIGSGFAQGLKSLTDLGELSMNIKKNLDRIKVGDLVHSDYTGGHIGIIVGIRDGVYYVAEATPRSEVEALVISELDTDAFLKTWDEVVLMDTYYLEDGELTDMWY